MFNQKHSAKNTRLHYSFTFFNSINLTSGLWMIFLYARGFSLIEIGFLESIFHISSFLFEVPTGSIADIYGRKISRILGRISFMISLFIMYFSGSFSLQAIGFMFCALGYNLESGAGEALIYDSLKFTNQESVFKKIKGRENFIFQAGYLLGLVLGGFLAEHNYLYSFGGTFFIGIGALLIAFMFIEPPRMNDPENKEAIKKPGFLKTIANQFIDSFQTLKKTPRISFLILFSETIFAFSTTLFFFLQNHWKINGTGEFMIGLFLALQCAVSAVSGLFTEKIESWIGEKGILLASPLLLVLCLWGVAFTEYEFIFFTLIGLFEGPLFVAISDYLNKLIPSENRATVLSLQSMSFSMIMIIIFPLTGLLADHYSTSFSFLILAITGSVFFLLFLIFSPVLGSGINKKNAR